MAGIATAIVPLTPTVPDAGDIAGDLATNLGSETLTTIVGVLPVLVPVLVGFWALGFVWKKLMPKKNASV
jgi:hypothetical protein